MSIELTDLPKKTAIDDLKEKYPEIAKKFEIILHAKYLEFAERALKDPDLIELMSKTKRSDEAEQNIS
jgi:hypothetical protein